MRSAVARLYEPLIGRDLPAIPDAVRVFREEHSAGDLFSAAARFAVLSFAPTQHGKNALAAIVAAHDVESLVGRSYDALLAQCAIYAAMSRLPWSEPPIGDPPSAAARPLTRDGLRAAIRSHDRIAAERWLASHLNDGDFAQQFFSAAAEDLSDYGQKLVVAVLAWRLTEMMPAAPRFSVLRLATWEWCARNEEAKYATPSTTPDNLLQRLAARVSSNGAPVDEFHLLSLLDAAFFAAETSGDESILLRVCGFIEGELPDDAAKVDPGPIELSFPVYTLARDYAEYLRAWSIAARWSSRRPDVSWDALRRAALFNRDHGPSFEEWNFA